MTHQYIQAFLLFANAVFAVARLIDRWPDLRRAG